MRIKNSGNFLLSAYSVYADKQLSAYTLYADKKLSTYTLYADKANNTVIRFVQIKDITFIMHATVGATHGMHLYFSALLVYTGYYILLHLTIGYYKFLLLLLYYCYYFCHCYNFKLGGG